jgi:tRNA (guanine37-N1)-methyltransferase
LRSDLKIDEEGGWLFLPLVADAEVSSESGVVAEHEFEPATDRGPHDYRELLGSWPAEEREELPRSYDVVGDIVLIRLPPVLASRGPEVGAALLRFVPRARLAGADYGVHGPERRREVQRLAGSGPWRTRHRENGIDFEVDVARAYFSPRLAREHARVAAEVGKGQRVYDLCCGVGPFALTIAHTSDPARVVAVDSNPAAIELLRATAARVSGGEAIQAVEAPVERFLEGAEPVERVILNLPHEGIKYLASVGNVVAPAGRLFYYEVTDRADAAARPEHLLRELGGRASWHLRARRVVHPYSPAADLVSYTFERSPG